MTFTEMGLMFWAVFASVMATHYWARHDTVSRILAAAALLQMKLLSEPEFYEVLRAKYQRDRAAGVFGKEAP